MAIHRWFLSVMLLGGAVLAASCAVPAAQQPAAPTEATAPAAQQPTAPPSSGEPVKVDLDDIFPAGEGRELVLRECTGCHTWVPVVIMQAEAPYWWQISRDHRDRTPGITDEEFNTLFEYIIANYPPDKPVPELPPALLDTWTSY